MERSSLQIRFDPIEDVSEFAKLKKSPDFDRFIPLFEGRAVADLEDKDLPALKRFAQLFVPATLMMGFAELRLIVPSCGPATILSTLSGESPPVARAISLYSFVDSIKTRTPTPNANEN